MFYCAVNDCLTLETFCPRCRWISSSGMILARNTLSPAQLSGTVDPDQITISMTLRQLEDVTQIRIMDARLAQPFGDFLRTQTSTRRK